MNSEESDTFPKWNINMKIWTQVLKMHKSIIHVATYEENALINMLSHSKTPKMQQVEHGQHLRKGVFLSSLAGVPR